MNLYAFSVDIELGFVHSAASSVWPPVLGRDIPLLAIAVLSQGAAVPRLFQTSIGRCHGTGSACHDHNNRTLEYPH